MPKIKYFIQQSWLLIICSFCFGLLIAVTNAALSPKIVQNKIDKLNRLTGALLPEAERFVPLDTEIEIKSIRGKKEKVKVYRAVTGTDECVGWSFSTAGPGFQDKIELVIAADKDFEKIAGFDVLASNETPGFGDQIKDAYFRGQFKDAPLQQLQLVKTGEPKRIDSEIVAITGATVSSEAVVEIINNSIIQLKDQLRKKGLIHATKTPRLKEIEIIK
ncbi:MAG: FMN-binding protein [Sedimentisphaerales bacterium]